MKSKKEETMNQINNNTEENIDMKTLENNKEIETEIELGIEEIPTETHEKELPVSTDTQLATATPGDLKPLEKKKPTYTMPDKILRELGIISDEMADAMELEKSEDEILNETYGKLNKYKHSGEVLWGNISGITYSETLKQNIINVIYNKINIQIPEKEFFDHSFYTSRIYTSLDLAKKQDYVSNMLIYYMPAKVCFILKDIESKYVKNINTDKEERLIFGVGSRLEAMDYLKDYYFFHRDADRNYRTTAKEGNIATANVLVVSEQSILVECLGVETWINAYSLSNDFITNCADLYKPGDSIKVRIQQIKKRDDTVQLILSGKIHSTPAIIKTVTVGSTYMGTVATYNNKKGLYTVRLINGCFLVAYTNSVQGHIMLYPGDKVAATVKSFSSTGEFLIGSVKKL